MHTRLPSSQLLSMDLVFCGEMSESLQCGTEWRKGDYCLMTKPRPQGVSGELSLALPLSWGAEMWGRGFPTDPPTPTT